MATALGLTLAGSVSREGVAGAVGRKQLLLVLDNCEHVIEAAAGMAATLLRASPGVSLLATSREPLRVDGEYVHRVPPLAVPAEDNQDMDDVLRYGAVKLFVSRASAAEAQCVSDVRLAAAIAAICRRLDGIELAAAGVAAGLDDRFRLLTGGNRTALRRHQTLVVQPQGEVSCRTRPRPRERSWGYWAEGGQCAVEGLLIVLTGASRRLLGPA